MRLPIALTALALFAATPPASAASDDAWEALRGDVGEKCLAAACDLFEAPRAIVDPFGSESYGLALVLGKAKGADADISAICVVDKRSGEAELGGELPADPEGSAGEAALPAFPAIGDCAGPCADFTAMLGSGDARWLRDLPGRVARTVAAIRADPALDWNDEARRALEAFEAGTPTIDPAAIPTGERSCTLYWYGFLDDAARPVGSHRCRVERRDDGTITLAKTSGERLAGNLHPIGEGAFAFAGRSYLAAQNERSYDIEKPLNEGNGNFGNVVGLAAMAGDRLVLVTADMLGFQELDPTFFGLLVIE